MKLEEKEKIEIEFWRDASEEKPEVFSIPNLINKFKEADIFLDKLSGYSQIFRDSNDILELGAGQGWASCMVKSYHPNSRITTTDISEFAVRSIPDWEKIFRVSIDHSLACKSYQIPLEDNSFDLVFCFASAHHFVLQEETIRELKRILKPGGRILYLHEPTCRRYIYSMAKKRVNRKRHAVPEDLLLYREIKQTALDNGFEVDVVFSPTIKNRSLGGGLYYSVLNKLPFLQKVLPCTADFIMKKK